MAVRRMVQKCATACGGQNFSRRTSIHSRGSSLTYESTLARRPLDCATRNALSSLKFMRSTCVGHGPGCATAGPVHMSMSPAQSALLRNHGFSSSCAAERRRAGSNCRAPRRTSSASSDSGASGRRSRIRSPMSLPRGALSPSCLDQLRRKFAFVMEAIPATCSTSGNPVNLITCLSCLKLSGFFDASTYRKGARRNASAMMQPKAQMSIELP
mmetsp:Transcript_31392/g.96979  ORF Transcript_31392/g.96979 Transcript_31392/m.96979 type:complete len:213 (+) Transcript_31392:152-790(+)